MSDDLSGKRPRKRPRAKRTGLQDSYPSYLQVAFFGQTILDDSKLKPHPGAVMLDDERLPGQSPEAKSIIDRASFTFPTSPAHHEPPAAQPTTDSDREHIVG